MTQFIKAQRKHAKLRLGLTGVSGSGKTFSALCIARGLVGEEGKIALVDTEAGSGELYGEQFNYDYARIIPPFHPNKYIDAISGAEDAGYDIIILDSISHEWRGTGGLLEMKDRVDSSNKNPFSGWKEVNPIHNAFVDKMLQCSMHLIATLRTKIKYEINQVDGGKLQVKRVGLEPVQREDLEYEFTTNFLLDGETHIATTIKDRTSLFDGLQFVPSKETGEILREWLESGADPAKISKASKERLLTDLMGRDESYDGLIQWYTDRQSEISMLMPSDREEVISQLKILKNGN